MSIARRVEIDFAHRIGDQRHEQIAGAIRPLDLEHLARGKLEHSPDRPHVAIAVVNCATREIFGPPLVGTQLGGQRARHHQVLAAQRLGGRPVVVIGYPENRAPGGPGQACDVELVIVDEDARRRLRAAGRSVA